MPTRRIPRLQLVLSLALAALATAAASAAAATPIDLGPAARAPRLATAESGAGHLTWPAGGDEALRYCRLDPGAGACSAAKAFPTLAGNDPYDSGNAPLLAPGRVLVLDGRQNPSEYKLLYSSADNFSAHSVLSSSSIAEINSFTDAVFAPAGTVSATKERILTVQSGPVSPSGGKFQAVSTSGAETTNASFSLSNGDETCAESIAWFGTFVYGAFINCDVIHPETAYIRRYQGDGALANLNEKTKWAAPAMIAPAYSNIVLAAGPSGLYVAYDRPSDKAVVVQRFLGLSWSEPVVLGVTDVHSGWFAFSQDSAGVLHLSWEQGGNLLYRYGRDATNSSFTNPQTLATGGNFDEQRLGVNAAGNGWISWLNFASGHAMALPLAPGEPSEPLPAPVPGTYKGPTKKTEKSLGEGLKATLTTPKGCVPGGQFFKVRLAVKRKGSAAHKASYTVKQVKFSLAGKPVSTDRRKPFEVRMATAGVPAGKTLTVAARVKVKLKKGNRRSTVTKTLQAQVKTCA